MAYSPTTWVAPGADGQLEVFVVGSDHGGGQSLWHRWQNTSGNGWSDWCSHGTPPDANGLRWSPTVASTVNGSLEVFVVGDDLQPDGLGSGGALHRTSQTTCNDGTPGATLPVPAQSYCDPLRWWDAPGTTVLASCASKGDSYTSSLWRVPIDGGAPTALTAPNDGNNNGKDHGDVNAWQLPAGTFVQALGACGVIFLAKLNHDGTTTPVSVPGLSDAKSIRVIGADGNALYLHAHAACGGGQSLLRYDPQANTSTVLLGPPINGGGVIDAVPYKGDR